MEPTDMIPVTMRASQWNEVMEVLLDARYRVAAPLINEIQRQAHEHGQKLEAEKAAKLYPAAETKPNEQKVNGAAHDAEHPTV